MRELGLGSSTGNACVARRRSLLAPASGVVPVAEGVPELSGLGMLIWVSPPGLVDRVVTACGRTEQP